MEKLILYPLKEAVVLVFLFIFIIFLLLLIFSKIRIEIINFRFLSQCKRHVNKYYKIIVKLCILNKIPILKINITKTKLEKLKIKEKVKNIDFKAIQKNSNFDKDFLKAIKELSINIQNISLNVELGTENATLTSIIVPYSFASLNTS